MWSLPLKERQREIGANMIGLFSLPPLQRAQVEWDQVKKTSREVFCFRSVPVEGGGFPDCDLSKSVFGKRGPRDIKFSLLFRFSFSPTSFQMKRSGRWQVWLLEGHRVYSWNDITKVRNGHFDVHDETLLMCTQGSPKASWAKWLHYLLPFCL